MVVDWLKFYERLHRNSMGVGGALHDPLALALIIDPTLVRTRPAHIAVDLAGSYTLGATVADFWNERGMPPNANIATEVDADRFFDLALQLASRLTLTEIGEFIHEHRCLLVPYERRDRAARR